MTEAAQHSLETLLEGNRRFIEMQNGHFKYADHHRAEMVKGQSPIAAVVACIDSRVVPEVIFDQPMGQIFVSRVPANVASDSAQWMIDIAVGEFEVPLVLVIGHTGCLALKQVMDGKSGPGGLLRFKVQSAVSKARFRDPSDVYLESIKQNAIQTVEDLQRESAALRDAIRLKKTAVVAGLYDMETGVVSVLDIPGHEKVVVGNESEVIR
jgi:carbonic anhydrase